MDEEHESEKEIIQTLKEDFEQYAKIYTLLLEKVEDFDKTFFKIKLAFLSFAGVVLTVAFTNKTEFSDNFLIILTFITVLAFILLAIELSLELKDKLGPLKKYHEKTILSKIRHSAKVRNNFFDYAERAQELLISGNVVEQQMLNHQSIDEIIKYKWAWFLKLIFCLWLIILISVPTLLLFEILEKLG